MVRVADTEAGVRRVEGAWEISGGLDSSHEWVMEDRVLPRRRNCPFLSDGPRIANNLIKSAGSSAESATNCNSSWSKANNLVAVIAADRYLR